MQTLAQAKQNFVYQVERIETEEKTKRHLQNIGVVAGSKIVVVNLSGNNAILLVKKSSSGSKSGNTKSDLCQ